MRCREGGTAKAGTATKRARDQDGAIAQGLDTGAVIGRRSTDFGGPGIAAISVELGNENVG